MFLSQICFAAHVKSWDQNMSHPTISHVHVSYLSCTQPGKTLTLINLKCFDISSVLTTTYSVLDIYVTVDQHYH